MRINVGGLLTKRSAMTPEREGLVCEGVRRTYRELNDRANRLANTMKGLGVTHGDRVGILALNEPEYYDMYFGLGKIGAILVPINHRLAGPEIQYILSDCEAKVLVFGREFAEVVGSIRSDIPAKDLVAITLKRLELARALATDPKVLLIDEVGAGLTEEEIPHLLDILKEIRSRGITYILIEHVLKVMMEAVDRITVIDYGAKIAEGTPAEVMENKKVITAYFG